MLPPDLITLATPRVADLVEALDGAILRHRCGDTLPPNQIHERVREMYQWQDVAERTEKVYNRVSCVKGRSFPERIRRFHQRDPLAGKLYVFALALMYVFYKILCFFQPEEEIDIMPDAVSISDTVPKTMPKATALQDTEFQQNEM